jgi:endogenous inhibitor of DNA gyrase (YacG/DUF329 family)
MTRGNAPASRPRTVRCPACGGASLYAPENKFRPFCGERCKLHDLGAWANERFRVEAEPDRGQDEPPPARPLEGR